ncbi:MAG: DUF5050 domain-containing protein [Patescibacteria group bacterium]|jgi:Tol biopolymer transport system component
MKQNNWMKIIFIPIIILILGIIGYFIFEKKPTIPIIITPQTNPISPPLNIPKKTDDLIIQETKELDLTIAGSHPRFSPDGQKILFESRGQNEGLWLIDINGSNLKNLYQGTLSAVDDYEWSPEGNFIFIVTFNSANTPAESREEVLNVINVQSKEVRQIFGPVANILYPKWISGDEIGFIYENKTSLENFTVIDTNGAKKDQKDDGRPIFFYTFDNDTGAGNESIIKSATRDGTIKKLTGDAFTAPLVSPDGTKIVYHEYTTPGRLMTMNIDGSEKTMVTTESGIGDAAWSPDGSIIAYSVEKDDGMNILEWDIYAINADGSGQIKLTNSGKKFAAHPRWSSDGRKLVFDYNGTGKIGLLIFK